MDLNRKRLDDAVGAGILRPDQADGLWAFLAAGQNEHARFGFTHILYYLGGLIAIGAMSLFMTLGWESFGGWGLFAIAFGYGIAGLWLTEFFLRGKQLQVPAGITATFVVVLIPLAVYGIQHGLGFWAEDGKSYGDYHRLIDWRWIVMELATLAGGAVLLYRYRLPFMVMPIAVTLWYMSMDLTPFLFGDDPEWRKREYVSVACGLLTLLLALAVDLRTRRDPDFAFWLYLFGTMAFWGGLTSMDSKEEWRKVIYLLINLGLIGVGAALARRVFVVFGGLGVAGYLGHLAYSVFKDSLLFPFALTAIGLAIIAVGVRWQRNEAALGERMRGWMPPRWRQMLENAS